MLLKIGLEFVVVMWFVQVGVLFKQVFQVGVVNVGWISWGVRVVLCISWLPSLME
jgi:hypothetical protein